MSKVKASLVTIGVFLGLSILMSIGLWNPIVDLFRWIIQVIFDGFIWIMELIFSLI